MKNERVIFQTRIPAKLILFGEWGVLRGHPAVGCSVGKYFELTVEKLSDPKSFIIESPEATYEWGPGIVPPFLEKSAQMIEFLFDDLSQLNGKKIIFNRQWPLSEGLGSSSAVFLSLLLLREELRKTTSGELLRTQRNLRSSGPNLESPVPKFTELAENFRAELLQYQGTGSGLDIVLQALGGFVSARFSERVQIQSESLQIPDEVVFVHTGKKMSTDVAIRDREQLETFADITKKIGQSTERFLMKREWEKAIAEHHAALCELGVVPRFVLDLENEWRDKKWISGLKTTGAGGGDTLLLFINACKRPEIEEDLMRRGFWLETAPLGVAGALEEIKA